MSSHEPRFDAGSGRPLQDAENGRRSAAEFSDVDDAISLGGAPATPSNSAFGPAAVWHAFRRWWLVALPLSIACGAAAGGIAWWTWEPTFLAAAHLRVASHQPIVMFNTADVASQPTYEIYKKTQRELIRNRYVLNAALRNPAVARLPLVQEQVDPVNWLQKQLLVSYPGDAEILEIAVRGAQPEALAELVNAVCDAYVEVVVHDGRNDRVARLHSLEKIRDDADENIRLKRTELRRLTETLGTNDSHAATLKQQVAIESYGSMRREQLKIQFELMRAGAKLATQKARLTALEQEEIPDDILQDAVRARPEYATARKSVEKIRESLEEEQRRVKNQSSLAGLRKKAIQAEEGLLEFETQVRVPVERELRRQLTQQLRTEMDKMELEVAALKAEDDHLGQEVAKFNDEALQIGRSSVDLEMKQTEIANFEAVRNSLAKEIETLKVELTSGSRIEVLSRATVPSVDSGMSRIRRAVSAGVVALFAPLFLFVVWDVRHNKVNSTFDVSHASAIRLVGALPLLPAKALAQNVHEGQQGGWNNSLKESTDAIREVLMRESKQRPTEVVLVTSAVGGEGKTTVACQLAMSFARSGKRTVLVDFDLRRPATHLIFDSSAEYGICDILRGTHDLEQLVQPTAQDNLFHISGGTMRRDSAKTLIASRREVVGSLIARLRADYETIIIDSAPVLPVVDTLIIGQFADVALISVMRDVSRRAEIDSAKARLEGVGIVVLGAIVTSQDAVSGYAVYRYSTATAE